MVVDNNSRVVVAVVGRRVVLPVRERAAVRVEPVSGAAVRGAAQSSEAGAAQPLAPARAPEPILAVGCFSGPMSRAAEPAQTLLSAGPHPFDLLQAQQTI